MSKQELIEVLQDFKEEFKQDNEQLFARFARDFKKEIKQDNQQLFASFAHDLKQEIKQDNEQLLARFARDIIEQVDVRLHDIDNRMEIGFSEIRQDMREVKRRLDKLEYQEDRIKLRVYDVEEEIRDLKRA